MISAVVVVEDGTCRVDVFIDRKVFHKTPFASRGEAEAYLTHSGYVRMSDPQDGWVPDWREVQFRAASLSRTVAASSMSLMDNGVHFLLHVVEVPRGFGFRFGFAHTESDPLTGCTVDDFIRALKQAIDVSDPDPLINILTTGLFTVEAIGTWATVAAAQGAGLAFFERTQELVGSTELLYKLLELERDRAHGR